MEQYSLRHLSLGGLNRALCINSDSTVEVRSAEFVWRIPAEHYNFGYMRLFSADEPSVLRTFLQQQYISRFGSSEVLNRFPHVLSEEPQLLWERRYLPLSVLESTFPEIHVDNVPVAEPFLFDTGKSGWIAPTVWLGDVFLFTLGLANHVLDIGKPMPFQLRRQDFEVAETHWRTEVWGSECFSFLKVEDSGLFLEE